MVIIDCKSPLTKAILEYQVTKYKLENLDYLITDNPEIGNSEKTFNISKLSPPFDIRAILNLKEEKKKEEPKDNLQKLDTLKTAQSTQSEQSIQSNTCCEELEIIKTKIFEVVKKHHTQMVSELEILLDRGNEKG